MRNPEYHSKNACTALLRRVFGDPRATMAQLAPEGWRQSPLWFVHHPTLEKQYEHYVRVHENISRLFKEKETAPEDRLLSFDEYAAENAEEVPLPVDEHQEFLDLFGNCVWEIFSNNHDVVSEDGRAYHLGSFRGSGDSIADFINDHFKPSQAFGYLDFYMGNHVIDDRADLTPVYELIFSRLKSEGCDWHYAFPRMFIISPDELREGLGLEEKEDPAAYDPGKALLEDLEKQERARQVRETRERLDDAFREEWEEAKHQPLPRIVQAYKNVFGTVPKGYPIP